MENMRFKVGDRVRIKSLDWYNMHCDDAGNVDCGCEIFEKDMKPYLGKVFTIYRIVDNSKYEMEEAFDFFLFTAEMIEGLVEEENEITEDGLLDEYEELTDRAFKGGYEKCKSDIELNGFQLPEGYQFVDENDNPINAIKITLRKKKEVIPNLQLDSIRTVREYDTAHSRIWLEIYEDNPEFCIFTHLLVDEDHRRKGYGTKAIEQAEIIAKDLGCDTIHLKVETNSWMHEWYLKMGYKWYITADEGYTWLTKSI